MSIHSLNNPHPLLIRDILQEVFFYSKPIASTCSNIPVNYPFLDAIFTLSYELNREIQKSREIELKIYSSVMTHFLFFSDDKIDHSTLGILKLLAPVTEDEKIFYANSLLSLCHGERNLKMIEDYILENELDVEKKNPLLENMSLVDIYWEDSFRASCFPRILKLVIQENKPKKRRLE